MKKSVNNRHIVCHELVANDDREIKMCISEIVGVIPAPETNYRIHILFYIDEDGKKAKFGQHRTMGTITQDTMRPNKLKKYIEKYPEYFV